MTETVLAYNYASEHHAKISCQNQDLNYSINSHTSLQCYQKYSLQQVIQD